LRYLTRFGHDSIGDLILGDAAFERYLEARRRASRPIFRNERRKDYPKRANEVLRFGDPGSSAGGEQPKFSAVVGPDRTPVLVKFSPKIDDAVSRRRADLLICEHLSLDVMRRFGHSSARSELIEGGGQVFLEVRRFDRTGKHGRLGLVSLRALDAEFVADARAWTDISQGLLRLKMITETDHSDIRWREWFGHLIGNTDMHSANLSFYSKFPHVAGAAPAYDMLPMLYAPQNEQLVEREFRPPLPKPGDTQVWRSAWAAGCEFWSAVRDERGISADFRSIARKNLAALRSLADLKELLP
jgi:hypothetical protein